MQILKKVITFLTNEGECVNLSPIRWLQDPLAPYKRSDYKKFENSISKHIKELENIPTEDAQKLFGALINTNLGIYLLNKGNYLLYKDEWKKITNEKHFQMFKTLWNFPNFEKFNEEKNKVCWFVTLRLITNPARKTFYNIYSNVEILKDSKTLSGEYYRDVMYKSKTFSDDRQLIGIGLKLK